MSLLIFGNLHCPFQFQVGRYKADGNIKAIKSKCQDSAILFICWAPFLFLFLLRPSKEKSLGRSQGKEVGIGRKMKVSKPKKLEHYNSYQQDSYVLNKH